MDRPSYDGSSLERDLEDLYADVVLLQDRCLSPAQEAQMDAAQELLRAAIKLERAEREHDERKRWLDYHSQDYAGR